jgi:hypothetical protein
METQLRSGTSNAVRRLPECVETRPTSQGTIAPPRVAIANNVPPIREAAVPKLADRKPIAMG